MGKEHKLLYRSHLAGRCWRCQTVEKGNNPMYNNRIKVHRFFLMVAIFILASCQALPVGPAPTPSPEIFISLEEAGAGPTIHGQVLWGAQLVPGAVVELRDGAWASDSATVLGETTADASGLFTMTAAPVGEYGLVALWPDGSANMAAVTPVEITAGEDLTDVRVWLAKEMRLLEPSSGALVEGAPTLRWQPLEGASHYRVMVIDAGTTELVADEQIEEVEFTVTAALTPGRSYQWLAQGLDEDGMLLGEVDSTFTVAARDSAYQGLTTDGKYYVAAVLPVNHPSLPADGQVTGNELAAFTSDFTTYLADVVTALNPEAASSFTPALTQLDAMMSSVEVQ
jgi:hypothetical protein